MMLMRFALIHAALWMAPPGKTTWDFEAQKPGEIARGFTRESGTWEIVDDSGNRIFAQKAKSEDAAYNIALIDASTAKDLDLSVGLKAVSGEVDRGGGLIWRAKDASNYYLARFNPLEDNYRLYKVVAGKRTQLASVKLPSEEGWHTLRVAMTGSKITCYLDRVKRLEFDDGEFPDAGKVGLWTKSDAVTYFDNMILIAE